MSIIEPAVPMKTELLDSMEVYSATDLSTKCRQAIDMDPGYEKPNDSTTITKFIKNKSLKSGNKKSFVWKYFSHPKNADGAEDRCRTECLECKSQLAFNASGTTTTMLNHLKSRHPKIAETEVYRKIKTSIKLGNCKNGLPLSTNSQSPNERFSPPTSSEPPRPTDPSPETNQLSIFPKIENNYLQDHGRLLYLANLMPQSMIVSSYMSSANPNINITTTPSQTSIVKGDPYGLPAASTNGTAISTSLYSPNRSAIKRKRKKPTSMQNENQLNNGGTNDRHYQVGPPTYDRVRNPDSTYMASVSHNEIISRNFLTSGSGPMMYNDFNNNALSSLPFMPLRSFTTSTVIESPNNPQASRMGISESDRIIAYWLIKDLRPYTTLEDIGIKTLFASLMPTVSVPTASNLRTQILPTIYWTIKTDIQNDFSQECGVSFSIELWDIPSRGNMYASVKLHYYSRNDFQLRNKMFATKEINAKHLCSDLLLSCCNELDLDFSKIKFLPVVMNNPESLTDELASVGEIEQNKKIIIIPCLMSSLQEVVKCGFLEPELIILLDKCRALKELAQAYNLQLEGNCSSASSVLTSSKYSSEEFDFIYWAFLNFDQIDDKLDCFNSNRFTRDDEVFLRQLTPLLEHIYQTLNVIEENKLFFSASMIKSIILTMNKSPFQPKDDDHQGVIQFKIAVKNRLCKIYPAQGELHEILWIATTLDPRFKKYQDEEESSMLQEIRNQTINSNTVPSSSDFLSETTNPIKREELHSIFGDDLFSQEPKSELDQYLNEQKIDIEKNPIKWWQDNSLRFPNLSKVAMKYLCIPLANQLGTESLGSDSILYSRRKDIDKEEIDHYLFLNHNWR